MPPLLHRLLSHPLIRRTGKFVLDLGLAWLAWAGAVHLVDSGQQIPKNAVWYWLLLSLATTSLFQLTRHHYRAFGFRDALRLGAATMTLLAGAAFSARTVPDPPLNLDVPLLAVLGTSLLWLALRAIARGWSERKIPPSSDLPHPLRTLIVGAGKAGALVAQEMRRHPELGARVIGFLDDALDKQGALIQGVPVVGTSELLVSAVSEYAVEQVILAIPSASGSLIRDLTRRLHPLPVKVKTVPGMFNLLSGRDWRPVLQDISIEDLLRRDPIELDQTALKEVLEDRVVLITGAGGSIGSEIARQVARFRPSRLILLGRGENSLWETERSLRNSHPNQTVTLALCNIQNETALDQIFRQWRPAVVFHAAAHKHVPYLESHPAEAVRNNVFGTRNVLEASLRHGVTDLVNVSTDKAVNPTNVLGVTKRIAECLVLEAASRAPEGTRFVSVRFGNVLGSRGSVVPLFHDQIRRGGPVTVTHPDMTRYFMTIPEASQLVLQAGLLGETGRVYVLDMGDPVKIMDLAEDMIRLSGLQMGEDIEIEVTGLRPGEKLFEELFTDREGRQSCVHPKVLAGDPEPVNSQALNEGLAALERASVLPDGLRQREHLALFRRLVPTYQPSRNGLARFEESPSGSHRLGSGSHAAVIRPDRGELAV